jgi:PGF-pre-PGF domain-containing protein/PGF-CTERM protein
MRLFVLAIIGMVALSGATGAAVAQPLPPHNVDGTVQDQNGDAISGITVEAVYDGEVIASGTTNSDGRYEFNVPEPNPNAQNEEVIIRVANTDGSATISWESGAVSDRSFTVERPSTPTPEPGTPTPGAGDPGDGGADDDDDDDDTGGAPSGGTSGGGSGGAPTSSTTQSTTLSNGAGTVNFGEGSDVQSVGVSVPGGSGDVTVQTLNELPSGVSEPSQGQRITTVDISAPNPTSGSATVSITVSRQIVDAFNANTQDLTIVHYRNGEWQELETTVVSEDPIVLEAQVTGFSPFAVVERQQTATTGEPTTEPPTTDEPTTDEPTEATTEPPTEGTDTPTGILSPGFGPVVAIVALLGLGLIALRRRD